MVHRVYYNATVDAQLIFDYYIFSDIFANKLNIYLVYNTLNHDLKCNYNEKSVCKSD